MRSLPSLMTVVLVLAASSWAFQAPTPSSRYVVRNVSVVDVRTGKLRSGVDVEIAGRQIVRIRKTGKRLRAIGTEIIDGSGKFLMPGLWDMHAHITDTRWLPLFIAHGVVGIRDPANPLAQQLQLREELRNGTRVGPELVTCGPIVEGTERWQPDFDVIATTEAEAVAVVQQLAKARVDCIKVYDSVPRAAYYALAAEAKRQRLPFVGHVPTEISSAEASDAGQLSIEHLGKIFEDSADPVAPQPPAKSPADYPRRIAARWQSQLQTFSMGRTDEILKHFVKNQTWQVPTLITKARQAFWDDPQLANDPRLKYVSPELREYWKPTRSFLGRYRTPDYIEARKQVFAIEMRITGAMAKAGVPLLAGTDCCGSYVYPGSGLVDELELMVKGGLSPLLAIQSATLNPARYLGRERTQGTIGSGKTADLILLDSNPLQNVANLRQVNAVFHQGRLFKSAELESIKRQAEYPPSAEAKP